MYGSTNPVPKLDKTQSGFRLAFFGPTCVGKTYCADYLEKYHDYRKYSLASKLKAIAYELYGAKGKNGDTRELYQKLGDSLRVFDDDVFSKYLLNRINNNSPKGKIVVDDVRLPREAHLLKANGFKLVNVRCPEDVRLGRVDSLYPNVPQDARSHDTETNYEKIHADYIVLSDTSLDTISWLDKLVEAWN